jgi:hypothetical protein
MMINPQSTQYLKVKLKKNQFKKITKNKKITIKKIEIKFDIKTHKPLCYFGEG